MNSLQRVLLFPLFLPGDLFSLSRRLLLFHNAVQCIAGAAAADFVICRYKRKELRQQQPVCNRAEKTRVE
jgi:hypothetical protein